ncbi:MAG: hypothetical protein PHQ35_10810 [Phycisphaerae bacterium]|nr:hypothetical protein [Phycisphaerae bacterium]
MALDPVLNFAKVEVSTGYDDAATTVVLTAGEGAKLPDPSSAGAFNLVWWNSTDYPDPADDPNKEIVRCTARSTDTLTVARNQESSGASTKNTGSKTYKMAIALTKKMKDDIGKFQVYDAVVAATGGDYTTVGAAVTAGALSIFVKDGTYAEDAITLSANTHIVGETKKGTIINMQANGLTLADDILFENLTIQGNAGAGSSITVGAKIVNFKNVYFDNDGSANFVNASNDSAIVYLNDCTFDIPNTAAKRGIYSNNNCTVVAHNITLIGGGANSQHGMYFNGSDNKIIIDGLTVRGTWNVSSTTANPTVEVYAKGVISNFVNETASKILLTLYMHNVVTNIGDGPSSDFNLYYYMGKFVNCYFYDCTQNSSADDTFMTNVYVQNSFTTGTGGMSYLTNCYLPGFTMNWGRSNVVGGYIGGNLTLSTSADKTVFNGLEMNGNLTINSGCTDAAFVNFNFQDATQTITDNGTATVFINVRTKGSIFEKRYYYMKNTDGDAMAAGDLVRLKAVAAGNEVEHTTTGGDDMIFGMAVEAIANNAFGHIQVVGKTTLLKVNGTTDIAIGDFISTYTEAGIGKKASAGDTAIAIALEAYTTDNSSGVIDALLITPRKVGAVV